MEQTEYTVSHSGDVHLSKKSKRMNMKKLKKDNETFKNDFMD